MLGSQEKGIIAAASCSIIAVAMASAAPPGAEAFLDRLSVLQPYGEGNSECGYCGSKEEKRVS